MPDVVQTALSEPINNMVYKQAKEQAVKRSKQGALFIDWWWVIHISCYYPHHYFISTTHTLSDALSWSMYHLSVLILILSPLGRPDLTLSSSFCFLSNKHEESSYSLEMTLKPHNGTIYCCSFSSDGKTVITSSSDATAKVRHHSVQLYHTISFSQLTEWFSRAYFFTKQQLKGCFIFF